MRCEDQNYIIDLCDDFLGRMASREHRFDFLRGDSGNGKPGRTLPVDAYYEDLTLVIEFHEKQHQSKDSVAFWDNKPTISGVPRKQQRAIYDQRRRDVLPQHGITLVEFLIDQFPHKGRKLIRDPKVDRVVIAKELEGILR